MSGLIAFEATARHLSFSRAAEDLALTQGAVSKRVRQLETVLGFQLLVRNTNQVCLTDVGENYLAHVKRLLRQVQVSTEDIRATARGKVTIRVSVPSVFAIRWLVPRMTGFSLSFPDHAVNLLCDCSHDDPRHLDADCAIFDGHSPMRDAQTIQLASSPYVVVASPDYLDGHDVATAQELSRLNLLRCNRTPEMWADWFAATGHNDVVVESASFDDLGVVIEAALCGHGVALLPQLLVAAEIGSGRLLDLFPQRPFRSSQYVLSIPQRSQGSDALARWGNWLVKRDPFSAPLSATRQ